MGRHNNIMRFLSGILLVVFVFGITPKRFLHDLVAKHIDTRREATDDHSRQLNVAGYNCDCDNLVAESPFVGEGYSFNFPLFSSFASFVLKNISFSYNIEIYSSLRGPPVIC